MTQCRTGGREGHDRHVLLMEGGGRAAQRGSGDNLTTKSNKEYTAEAEVAVTSNDSTSKYTEPQLYGSRADTQVALDRGTSIWAHPNAVYVTEEPMG